MKKLLALLMVCGFALTFVACGGGEKEQSQETTTPETETPAQESETEMEADTTDAANDTIQ